REEIERRNRVDTLVYEVEKNSKEWVEKLDASLKARLDKSVEGAKQALRSGSADEISKALDELQQAYSAAGASLYAAQRGAGAPGAEPRPEPARRSPRPSRKTTSWTLTTRSWTTIRRNKGENRWQCVREIG